MPARSYGLILPVGMREKIAAELLRMYSLRKWIEEEEKKMGEKKKIVRHVR